VVFLIFGGNIHKAARKYLSQYDKDINPAMTKKAGRMRVVLGTFSYVDSNYGKLIQTSSKTTRNNMRANVIYRQTMPRWFAFLFLIIVTVQACGGGTGGTGV